MINLTDCHAPCALAYFRIYIIISRLKDQSKIRKWYEKEKKRKNKKSFAFSGVLCIMGTDIFSLEVESDKLSPKQFLKICR